MASLVNPHIKDRQMKIYCDHCKDQLEINSVIFNHSKKFCSISCMYSYEDDRIKAIKYQNLTKGVRK